MACTCGSDEVEKSTGVKPAKKSLKSSGSQAGRAKAAPTMSARRRALRIRTPLDLHQCPVEGVRAGTHRLLDVLHGQSEDHLERVLLNLSGQPEGEPTDPRFP